MSWYEKKIIVLLFGPKVELSCLLQGKFYNELVKQNLREYKKLATGSPNK